MNTVQINPDLETGDEITDGIWRTMTNHSYNLRPCMTGSNCKYALTQDGQQ